MPSDPEGYAQARMANSQLVKDGESSMYDGGEDTRTENLRNFIEQAQPADGLLQSQGPSQLSVS